MEKIGTLKNTEQKKVDWDAMSYEKSKGPGNRSRWATNLAEKKFPTGKVMHNQGSWPTPARTRNFGPTKEYMTHIFHYKKGTTHGET